MPDKAQVERILVFLERSGYNAERLAEMRTFLGSLSDEPGTFTASVSRTLPTGRASAGRRRLSLYSGKASTPGEIAALLLVNYDDLARLDTSLTTSPMPWAKTSTQRRVDELIGRLLTLDLRQHDAERIRGRAAWDSTPDDAPGLIRPTEPPEGMVVPGLIRDVEPTGSLPFGFLTNLEMDGITRLLLYSTLPTAVRAMLDPDGGLLTQEERDTEEKGELEASHRAQLDEQLDLVLANGNTQGYLSIVRKADGTLWYSPQGGGVEMKLEIPDDLASYEQFVQGALAGADLSPYLWHDPETGALSTQVADPEEYRIPTTERVEPFIGGIPADFVSRRLIVKPNPDDPTDFDFRQRRFEAKFGEYTDDPYMVHRFGEAGRDRPEIVYAGPVHEEWDPYALFAGKDPAYLAMTQRLLLDAGYLDPQDVVGTPGGYWLSNQAEAAASWLFEANVNGFGNDPFRFLEDLASQGRAVKEAQDAEDARQGRTSSGRSGPKYHAPDYATLAQAVKQTVSAKVGRDVKDYEMTLLAEKLAADHRAQFDAAVSAAGGGTSGANRDIGDIADYMLRNQEAGLPATAGLDAFLAGFDPTVTTKPYLDPYASDLDDLNPQVPDPDGARSPAEFPADYVAPTGGGGGGTVQDVDPMARLEENVESMFATEIDRNKRVADIRGNTHHMMNVLAGLEGA